MTLPTFAPADQRRPIRASVIVVSYNNRDELAPCLDSIVRELGAHDELIVVDNGSTDGSADLVCTRYPQAQLIREANIGYAGGNNRGAAVARGEFLVILNPDTILLPDTIDALLEPFAHDPDIGLTTACIVHMDAPDTVNTCGNTMHYTGLTYCRGAGQNRSRYTIPAEVDAVSGAAFAIRQSLFTALGGFDAQFFMYVEDTDLSWRARAAGYRCLYTPDAIVQHAYQPAYSPTKAFYLDRNRHLMLLKNLSRATYLRLIPALLLSEIVTGGFLLLNGPRYWLVKLHVYRWLWTHHATIRTTRRAVQAHRRQPDRAIMRQMTYRLEFGQFANRGLARGATLLFHPAFRAARRLVAGSAA